MPSPADAAGRPAIISQIALPLRLGITARRRIVIGNANAHVAEALSAPQDWPYRTAILTGPARSGKSLFARWFAERGLGQAVDDAPLLQEAEIFHRWNLAQEEGTPLLIIGNEPPWRIALPDLASRLGAALQLQIDQPDDTMASELLLALGEEHGILLGPDAASYLVPRAPRSFALLERLVIEIDRLSLERKAPATLSIWRAALEAVVGPDEPRLL